MVRSPSTVLAALLPIVLFVANPCLAGTSTALHHALKPGQRLTYAQGYRTDSRSDARSLFEQGDGAAADASLVNELRIQLGARMQVEVLEADAQGWLLGIHWDRVTGTITANGRSQAPLLDALRRGLALPLSLRMDRAGQFLALYLDPALDPSVMGITRALLAQLQCIIPAGAGRAWEVEEVDPAGRFAAVYQVEGRDRKDGPVRLRKWLARYLPPEEQARPGDLKVDRSLQVMGSRGLGFDARAGHLVFMEGHEVQRTIIAGKTVSGSDLKFAVRLTGSGRLKAAALLARREQAQQQVVGIPATSLFIQASREEQETAVQTKALGASTADEIFESLRAADGRDEKEGGAVYLKLKALAFLHPEVCPRMGDLLAKGNPESLSMRLLASALSTTGSPPCQEAMATAIRSRREDWPAMAVLVPALGQCQDPAPASITLLEELAYDSKVVSIASTAQLMLGSMAFNLARQGAPEKAEGILETTLTHLAQAKDPVLAARFLLSLGNAGSPRTLPALKAWTTTPDPELRAVALYALRWIAGPEVDALLLKALASDPEIQVRYKVVEAFKYRPSSQELVASLQRVVAHDASPRVRLAALGSLWDLRSQYPEVARTAEAARQDPDEDVRRLAESFFVK